MKLLGKYTTLLEAEYHPDMQEWMVSKDFWFVRPCGDAVLVPAGFYSDLASTRNVPGFPSDGPWNQAALVHDYLYAGEFVPRAIADAVFREALEAIPEVPRWKIPVMWAAVRLFGGFTYGDHSAITVYRARRLSGFGAFQRVQNCPLWADGQMRFIV